jgi:hypothetical protein
MIAKWLSNVIVAIVTLVWAGNFLASVLVPDYHTDGFINFVFMAIVGSALALKSDGTGSAMIRTIAALKGLPFTSPPAAPEEPKKGEDPGE